MNKIKKQIILGIIAGITLTVIIQHFLFGGDVDYNIFYQIGRILS